MDVPARRHLHDPGLEPVRRADPQPVPGGVLALQRLAGNRAVAEALAAARRTVQRVPYHNKGSGADNYDTEEFTCGAEVKQRERAKKATIYVSPKPTGGRAAAPVPISFVSKDTKQVDDEIREGWHRGHMAGLEIGGENESYNIAPMLPGFNRGGDWRGVEHSTRQAGKASGKDNLRATIEFEYGGGDERVPSRVTVRREKNVPITGWTAVAGDPTVLSHAGARTSAPDKAEAKFLKSSYRGAALLKAMDWDAGDKEARKALRDGHLPQSKAAQWPDDPSDRFYENLDMLNLGGKLDPPHTVSSGRDFSGLQRTLIIKANIAKNGSLTSDDPKDPHQDLDESGRLDFPEVDHIIPKSSGGANAFSNARLVSWELNNRVARVKNISSLVDTRRLAEPVSPGVEGTIEQMMIRGPKAGFTADEIYAHVKSRMSWMSLTDKRKELVERAMNSLLADGSVVKDASAVPERYKSAL